MSGAIQPTTRAGRRPSRSEEQPQKTGGDPTTSSEKGRTEATTAQRVTAFGSTVLNLLSQQQAVPATGQQNGRIQAAGRQVTAFGHRFDPMRSTEGREPSPIVHAQTARDENTARILRAFMRLRLGSTRTALELYNDGIRWNRRPRNGETRINLPRATPSNNFG